MSYDINKLKELEKFLRVSILNLSGKISYNDMNDIEEYINHCEYGLAYELILFIINKQSIGLPISLKHAAKLMGIK